MMIMIMANQMLPYICTWNFDEEKKIEDAFTFQKKTDEKIFGVKFVELIPTLQMLKSIVMKDKIVC